jgi:hypothetical protein
VRSRARLSPQVETGAGERSNYALSHFLVPKGRDLEKRHGRGCDQRPASTMSEKGGKIVAANPAALAGVRAYRSRV